jgi:hypothetical protein
MPLVSIELLKKAKNLMIPYAYFVNNLQSYMDEGKKNNPLDQFSGFDAIQRPNEYALAQYFNIGEFISDFLPKRSSRFYAWWRALRLTACDGIRSI